MMNNRTLRRLLQIIGSILLILAVVALVALWSVVEAAWLRLQFRGHYESFDLWSEHVGDTFVIHVHLPRDYDPARAYPAIFVLDGDIDARPMAGVVSQQGLEAIVFGIGYGSDEADARERDYTPFVASEIDWAPSGGGEAFYAFMIEELIPQVETRYRTLGAEHRVLAGHSLAGLATVYALLRSPTEQPSFSGYIAASPTLPLTEGAIFDLERSLAENSVDMPGVLFLSMGGRESTEMQQAMVSLATILREHAYPNLTVHTLIRRGRGHGGNNWQSYIDGIRLMHEYGIV
jgi:predicted alpha/beta superfamily hydrolase